MQSETQQWRCPADRHYDAEHLWVMREGDAVVLGVTDYLQDTAGAILFVQLPAPGTEVAPGEQLFSLEAAKWVGHFNAPVAGRVIAVNEDLRARPGLANEDPYGRGWLVRLRPAPGDLDRDGLMTAEAYGDFLRRQAIEEGAGGW